MKKNTEKSSLASEIISEQETKNKKLQVAVMALAVTLIATTVRRKEK